MAKIESETKGKIWALPVYKSGKKKGQLKHTRFVKLPLPEKYLCYYCGEVVIGHTEVNCPERIQR